MEVVRLRGQPASLGVWCMAQLSPTPLELPSHASVFKEKDTSVFNMGMISPLYAVVLKAINDKKTDL